MNSFQFVGYILGLASVVAGLGFVFKRSADRATVESLTRRADTAEKEGISLRARVTSLEAERDHYKQMAENFRDSMQAREDIKAMREDDARRHRDMMKKIDLIHEDLVSLKGGLK